MKRDSGNTPAETVQMDLSESSPRDTLDIATFNPELAKSQMNLLIDASQGVPLIIVLLPSAPYISGGKIEMTDPAHERLKDVIEQFPEVTIVDPLPEFQQLASLGYLPRGFFNSAPGEGHLNEDGNKIVGRLLAKSIEQVLK
jgi:hypothetical protein